MRLRTVIAVCIVVAGCDENEPQGVPGPRHSGEEVPTATTIAAAVSTSTGPGSSGAGGGEGGAGAGGSAQGGAGGEGGEGGSLPEGAFSIAPTSFVDVGGRVRLRVLRTEEDGTLTEITSEAELESITPNRLTFEEGRAVGVSGGTATVRIVHDGREALADVRVRRWTQLESFPEPGTPSGRSVGYDGSVLIGARNDATSRLQLWYAAPNTKPWKPVGEGSALGVVPLSGGRFLVPTPYHPEPFPVDVEPQILGPDLVFVEPTPALDRLDDIVDALPYDLGRCALLLHDEGRQIHRWCEDGDTDDVAWPRLEGGDALLRADDSGRIGLLEEAGETVRALVEDGDGGWSELVLDAPARSYASMAFGSDGQGWVAWWSAVDDSGIMAARITETGFDEPTPISLVGERSALAVLPDGTTVLYWSDSSPPDDFLPQGVFVLPEGPSLDAEGVLFGGAGGLVTLLAERDGETEQVWSTDGLTWSVSDELEACDASDGFTSPTPAGGFVRARRCDDAWSFDVYR